MHPPNSPASADDDGIRIPLDETTFGTEVAGKLPLPDGLNEWKETSVANVREDILNSVTERYN